MLGPPSITEIRSFTQILSAAELLAFAGGQIPVVPPPGDGKLNWPISAFLEYNFNTVGFSSTPHLNMITHSGNTPMFLTDLTNFASGVESQYAIVPCQSNAGVGTTTAPDVNQSLDLQLVSGAFALGGVGAASITAAGTGYAVGDTGTITTGGTNATYRITSIGAAGAVTGFVITHPGSGYATGAGQATATGGAQPGVGINFTVNVTSIVNGDGTLKVTTLYQVIDVP